MPHEIFEKTYTKKIICYILKIQNRPLGGCVLAPAQVLWN